MTDFNYNSCQYLWDNFYIFLKFLSMFSEFFIWMNMTVSVDANKISYPMKESYKLRITLSDAVIFLQKYFWCNNLVGMFWAIKVSFSK